MKIKLKPITVKDVFDQFVDNGEDGVFGYHGQLSIRPKYQREFVYDEPHEQAVIDTVINNLPLNTMYWSVSRDDKTGKPIVLRDDKTGEPIVLRDDKTGKPILDKDGKPKLKQKYELLDGQQRILSICYFLKAKFSYQNKTSYNLKTTQTDIYKRIMNYELQVYICDGAVSEKLKWFRTINTAGVPLTEQELLNAQYTGAWLSDAKSYFSRNSSGAATYTVVPNSTAKKYLSLTKDNAIDRQGLLQTAILWATAHDKLPKRTPQGDSYMSLHQGDNNAQELESYFNSVFDWVGSKFKQYRKEEKGLDWGTFYNNYQDGLYKGQLIDKDGGTIEQEIKKLMADDEVTSKKGIYKYILDGEEKHLSLRAFDKNTAKTAYAQRQGRCPYCDQKVAGHTYPKDQESAIYGINTYEFSQMQADHIVPWSKGGKTVLNNCQMLCKWV